MSSQSSSGRPWQRLRAAVLARDNYTCVYCGREATDADHILPKAKGGEDALYNLVAACSDCNGQKSDKLDVRLNWYDESWLTSL